MQQTLNETFLQQAFQADWRRALVNSFAEDPTTAPAAVWNSMSVDARQRRPGAWPLRRDWNNYFCVSLFHGERRLETQFEALCVLAVDDVGKKADAGQLLGALGTPAWALETSPGNQQWFWFLVPWVTDLGKARALTRLVPNDARDVTRLVRLPVGVNTKLGGGGSGFATRVVVRGGAGGAGGTVNADEVLAEAGVTPAASWDVGRGAGGRGLTRTPGGSVLDRIGGDLVGRLLLDWGRVKGLTANGLGVEIECPWESSHTVRTTTGTAYFPKTGGFECHHGHCAGKTGLDLRRWIDAEMARSGLWEGGLAGSRFGRAEDGDSGDAAGAAPNDGDRVLSQYVLLLPDYRYLDMNSGQTLSIEAFNREERPYLGERLRVTDAAGGGAAGGGAGAMKTMSPHTWFERHGGKTADAQTYWPGRGRFFREGALRLANRWRPGPRPARGTRVSDADVKPWTELVEAICANEGPGVTGMVLDWFALAVGEPGVKPGWHLVLHSGTHGIGKDMMLRVVREAVGDANVAAPAVGRFGGSFNSYLESRLVVVSDLERNTRGAMTTHDVYETIKPFTEHTSKMIEVNRKYAQPYHVPNLTAWVITTNAEDALPLADSDRRFVVIMSTMARRDDAYYAGLRSWIDDNWGKVAEWLIERWRMLPRGRRDVLMGHAPRTPGKTVMTLAGEDRLTSWTREQIEDDIWPDLMSSRDLQYAYDRARLFPGAISANRWGRVLSRLGGKQLYGGNQVKLNSGRVRVWAIRNFGQFRGLSEKDIAQAYEAAQELH